MIKYLLGFFAVCCFLVIGGLGWAIFPLAVSFSLLSVYVMGYVGACGALLALKTEKHPWKKD